MTQHDIDTQVGDGGVPDESPPEPVATEEVVHFARIHNLSYKLDVLQKASLLLQGDTLLEEIPGITDQEVSDSCRVSEQMATATGHVFDSCNYSAGCDGSRLGLDEYAMSGCRMGVYGMNGANL